jgi:hypothetical protein
MSSAAETNHAVSDHATCSSRGIAMQADAPARWHLHPRAGQRQRSWAPTRATGLAVRSRCTSVQSTSRWPPLRRAEIIVSSLTERLISFRCKRGSQDSSWGSDHLECHRQTREGLRAQPCEDEIIFYSREAELAGHLNYGAALVATRVHRAFFDETQGIAPGILGIERSLTPGAHDDAASGCIVNVLARQTVQRLRTFECWF